MRFVKDPSSIIYRYEWNASALTSAKSERALLYLESTTVTAVRLSITAPPLLLSPQAPMFLNLLFPLTLPCVNSKYRQCTIIEDSEGR